MRIFSSARIAVIDADSERRAALCSALAGLGLAKILSASSFEQARDLDDQAPLDICVVQVAGQPYPFDPARTPAILLSSDFSGDLGRKAAQGYRAVLPASAPPRLIYRRIGSILQKMRRVNRAKTPEFAVTPVQQAGLPRS